ncbi:MAG: VCBS domain-containing protein [Oceanicola sp.]|nr:VCBS domain-containing protein [Oceanicola sp.]
MPGSAYFLLNGTDAGLFGSSISSAGNFDAASSGISEFIIGSAGDSSVGATILTGFDSGVGTGILADGSNLARITFETSVSGDQAGFEVIGGVDVNGDSIDDVALLSDSALYVIYGGVTALNSNLTEADLTGTVGLVVSLSDITADAALQAADLDNDGTFELLVGLPDFGADALTAGQGRVTVVDISAGTATTSTTDGLTALDALGAEISGLPDINNDGNWDVILGAPGVDGAASAEGAAYVVFGQNATNPLESLDLSTLDGTNGFTLTGIDATDQAGAFVAAAGDLNGDSIADLLVSAPQHDAGAANSGEVYVVYGKSAGSFPASLDLGNLGADGLTISGGLAGGRAGLVATTLGDVTGDDQDDLLILGTDGAGDAEGYLIFGGSLSSGTLDLGTLTLSEGYRLTGLDLGLQGDDPTGASIGDVNNDGINDFALSAPSAGAADNGAVVGLLGGLENLKALDGNGDGVIDLAALTGGTPPAITFVETTANISYSGSFTGTIDLRQNETTASDDFSITDTTDPSASFDTKLAGTPEGTGSFGRIDISENGSQDRWIYTLTAAAGLAYLGNGETFDDVILVTASNGKQREVTVTITGEDDAAQATLSPHLTEPLTEDFASYSGDFSLVDVDQNDNPNLAGATLQSTHGRIEISADGASFTFFLEADLSNLAAGQSVTETFSTTSNGVPVSFSLDIAGRTDAPTTPESYDLPVTGGEIFLADGSEEVTGSAHADRIDTGHGDDVILGLDGDDVITDPGGDDKVTAGAGNDTVTMLSGENTVSNGGGDASESNFFSGGIGPDTLTGGDGKDVLDGDHVSSFLGASDTLEGGGGDDVLRGGIGADTFVFRPGDDSDRIADFETVDFSPTTGFVASGFSADFVVGTDVIELIGFTSLTSSADALAAVADVNGHATFSSEGTTIIFHGLAAADFTADEFILV